MQADNDDHASEQADSSRPALIRSLNTWTLAAYGIGDMLGAGIYALVGKAAGVAGNAVWMAFLAAMAAALLTGLCYASLASRYPRAAGAAYMTQRAFRRSLLSYVVGLTIVASGLTSMATASRAFAGYLHDAVPGVPRDVLVLGFIAFLAAFNFWGMRQSSWLNVLCTTVEAAGLVTVIIVGAGYLGSVNYLELPAPAAGDTFAALLILQGAVLTFYAFIGFEDMLNVAEEVKDPTTVLPRAMLLAMLVVALIYIGVSLTAVSVVPYAELAAADAPLVEVVRRAAPAFPPVLFTAISLFAIMNTALVNYIMASRLVYGMAAHGLLPKVLGSVHQRTHTPHVAILLLLVLVSALALLGNIEQLASATSLLLLSVFVVVNLALAVLKRRHDEPRGAFEIPLGVPLAGSFVCMTLIAVRLFSPEADFRAPMIAGCLIAAIAVLYLIRRPREVTV